jgi:undecaprenyl-diphosphatase
VNHLKQIAAAITNRDGIEERRPAGDRTRGRAQVLWDWVFRSLRLIGHYARNLHATVGIFLLIGAFVAFAGTFGFAELAEHVRKGSTLPFDDAVLRWFAQHRTAKIDAVMLEITFLGTATVVLMIVGISAMFLGLSGHRYSALLLLASTGGGIILNSLLKFGFERPRPRIFNWGTNAVSWSFPSGHAMSAAVAYFTVAYLAARLQKRHSERALTFAAASLLVLAICVSRLYLGVHYPSDVLAGVIVGLAWAGFCMATLEAVQLYSRGKV